MPPSLDARLRALLRDASDASPDQQAAAAQQMELWMREHGVDGGHSGHRRVGLWLGLAALGIALLVYGPGALAGAEPARRVRQAAPWRARALALPGACPYCPPVPECPRAAAAAADGRPSAAAALMPSSGGGAPAHGGYPAHGAFAHPRDALRAVQPIRNTSDAPLIVCVGHGKTATKSLNKALVMLGYHTAHFYGAGVYGLLWDNAAEWRELRPGRDFLFHGTPSIDAVLDTPVVDFYHEIMLAYPNAKVVLTVRDPKSWLRSQQKFYCCYAHGCKNWLEPWRRGSNLVYGTECPSPSQAIKRYVQHNRNVYDAVPRDRLLVMDIARGDGWDALAPFLGIPVPHNLTFPNRH